MKERDIMKNFLRYIQKERRFHLKWLLFWICGMITFVIDGETMFETGEKLNMGFHTLIAGVFFALSSMIFFGKYTQLVPTTRVKNKDGGIGFLMLNNLPGVDLSGIIRSHGFDVKAYFCLLIERFLPVQGISIIAVLLAGIYKLIPMSNAWVFSGVMLVIPFGVWFLEMTFTNAARTHKRGIMYSFFSSVWYFVETIFAVLLLARTFIIFSILLSGTIQDKFVLSGVDESAVVQYISKDFSIVIIIILSAILAFFFADVNKQMLQIVWTKGKRIIVCCMILTIIGLMFAQGYSFKSNNVALYEKNIAIKKDGNQKTYGFDRIESYRIYNDSGLKMQVVFSDGTEAELFNDASLSTEGWSERYKSDYQYVSELVDILLERGVQGTVDESGFEKYMSWNLDPEDKAYMEHIMKVL